MREKSTLDKKTTFSERGFGWRNFKDFYGFECSIQESSNAERSCIWFGLESATPKIMARDAIRMGLKPVEGGEKDNGWVAFSIPDEVSLNTRMHLTQEQVKALIPVLKHFVKHGVLPE